MKAEIARLGRSITLQKWMIRIGHVSMVVGLLAGIGVGVTTRKFGLGSAAFCAVLVPYVVLSFIEMLIHERLARWKRIPETHE